MRQNSSRKPVVHGYRNTQPRPQKQPPSTPEPPVRTKSALSGVVAGIFRFCLLVAVFAGVLLYPPIPAETDWINRTSVWDFERKNVAESIAPYVNENAYPKLVPLKTDNMMVEAVVEYHFDPGIKKYIDELLEHYGPDFAAVVAMEPESGRILALSSYVRDGEPVGNLTVHSEFPAASLFKIVTATAAIDRGIATPKTVYEFNGKDTSLYKKHVLRHKRTKWTRTANLSEAFGRSINTVFGRIGVFDVGGDSLMDYSKVLGFDQPLPIDISVASSRANFNPKDEWSVAEAGSGYTKSLTMSPLHAAMMVATIVNDGKLVEPRLVKDAHFLNGPMIYSSDEQLQQVLDADTAKDMRVLMRKTVQSGSARKRFRGFFKGSYADLDVGGKTGSLTGLNPKGRTEWFAGYGDSGENQIAVAAVVVNKKVWRVKPSYLARKIFEEYFKPSNSRG